MLITDTQLILGFIMLAGALYYTWQKAFNQGYDTGYFHACEDVAEGNIKVEKVKRDD